MAAAVDDARVVASITGEKIIRPGKGGDGGGVGGIAAGEGERGVHCKQLCERPF